MDADQESLQPLAVYGSLRRGGGARLALEPACTFIGRGCLSGALYDLGDYPGLVPGYEIPPQLVEVEIYRLPDAGFLATIDHYEGFLPDRPDTSLFLRRTARLEKPTMNAWIYVWNGSVLGRRRVASGDWIAELDRRRL